MRNIAYALVGLMMALAAVVALGSPAQAATAGNPSATAQALAQGEVVQKVHYYRRYGYCCHHNRYRSHWRWGSYYHRHHHYNYCYRPRCHYHRHHCCH